MSNFKIYEKPKNKWTAVPIVPAPHSHEFLTSGDTRNVNSSPSDYKRQLQATGLKSNSAIGLPSSEGSYSSILGYGGWTDSSGGAKHELGFGGNGGLYHRYGSTSWNAWNKIATENWVRNELSKVNVDLTPYLKHDGSTPMTGNLPMNGKRILGVKNINFHGGDFFLGYNIDHITVGVEEQVYRAYKDKIDLANSRITNLSDPTLPKDATNKQWVENYVADNSGGSGEWVLHKDLGNLVWQLSTSGITPNYINLGSVDNEGGDNPLQFEDGQEYLFTFEWHDAMVSGQDYGATFHYVHRSTVGDYGSIPTGVVFPQYHGYPALYLGDSFEMSHGSLVRLMTSDADHAAIDFYHNLKCKIYKRG